MFTRFLFIFRSSDQRSLCSMVYVPSCFSSKTRSCPNGFVNFFSDQMGLNVKMAPHCLLCFWANICIDFNLFPELFSFSFCVFLIGRQLVIQMVSVSCLLLTPSIVQMIFWSRKLCMITWFIFCVSDQKTIIFEWCQCCCGSDPPSRSCPNGI